MLVIGQGFLGVPFAAAPERFAAAVEHPKWTSPRDATAAGSQCMQHGLGGAHGSEDCLFLNVFMQSAAPVAAARPAPVLVEIHGGGFQGGRASQLWNLTRVTGVVTVSIQYRLNVFGFFSTSTVPPNFGLQDQRLALQWVRDNAAAFGGDRNRVMIYGSSAGGASVAGHLVLPESAGLFHAAAIESPGGHQGWMPGTQRTDDDWMSTKMLIMFSNQLAMNLGCETQSNATCLRSIDMQNLSAAASKVRFAPALEREGAYPLGLIRRGEYTRVPTIVGGQSCESCNHAKAALGPYDPAGQPISKESFDAALVNAGFYGTMLSTSGRNESGVGPELLEVWYAKRIATEGRWRTFARILSDSGHACSAALHAQALGSTSSTVWRYFFEYTKSGSNVPGACHGAQRNWVNAAIKTTTPSQLALEQSMAHWWSSLGVRGSPNGPFTSVEWTAYVPGVADDAMFLDVQPRLPAMNASLDTKREECEHWKGYLGW
eukprot:COSAG02_NODE_286_length_25649_cov_13.411272_20_plen_488_part_00